MMYPSKLLNYLLMTNYALFFLVAVSLFLLLYCHMRKYHHYEHRVHYKSMCCYFACAVFYFIILMMYNILIHKLKEHTGVTTFESQTKFYKCGYRYKSAFIVFEVLHVMISEVHLPEIFFCLSIFLVKPSTDVL